jgi:hypothetical protein
MDPIFIVSALLAGISVTGIALTLVLIAMGKVRG